MNNRRLGRVLIFSLLLLLIIYRAVFAADGVVNEDLTKGVTLFVIQLGVIIFAAWLGGALFSRMRLPAVLGEIVAGAIIGPYFLGNITIPGFSHGLFPLQAGFPLSVELYTIAAVASIILLFLAGVETDIDTFLRFSVTGTVVGLVGVIASFVLGDVVGVMCSHWIAGVRYGFGHPVPLFLGVISAATSVGISARILSEKRKMDSPEGITIMTAAVIDDVLGIIALAIVVSIVRSGSPHMDEISLIALKAVGIWLGFTALGIVFAPRLSKFLKGFKNRITISIMSFAMALLLAGIFEKSGLAMIVGAYVMGLALSKTDLSYIVQDNLAALRALFVPVFFCSMGMLVNFREMFSSGVIAFGLVYLGAAIVSKLVGCGVPAWFFNFNLRGSTTVGIGMIPRGEVALIIAGIGLATGIVPREVFSVSVFMTFLTTLITPPLLEKLVSSDKPMLRKAGPEKREHKIIHYEMPNAETAELVLSKVVLAFEKEGFFVNRLEVPFVIFQIRKNETFITLTYNIEMFVFECAAQDASFVHTLFYEVIAEIEYAMKSLQTRIDKSQIGRNIFDTQNGKQSRVVKIGHIINPLAVQCGLKGTTKSGIIKELVDLLVRAGQLPEEDREKAIQDILEREVAVSTGMQDGIALPHTKTAVVRHMISAVGIKKEGVDFNSLDNKPAQIIILTLVPKDSNEPYLQYMAELSKLLMDEQTRNKLMSFENNRELYGFLASYA
ncbi:MAG: cation:proton antiporter [Candidatus Omnitrophota bacterium]